jgi:glucose-1-phosphate cytidylyltransferase
VKVAILAGGLGTQISQRARLRPGLVIEVGVKSTLSHVLKICIHHAIHDVIICCGFKRFVIKEYFADYFLHIIDDTFDMRGNSMSVNSCKAELLKEVLADIVKYIITAVQPRGASELWCSNRAL